MSCMMLSPAHIATVAHGLAYLLNQSEMCQLSAADELRDALGACRYPHDFLYDDRRIYPVLYRHNEAAYEGRYKAEPDETDEVPAMPDNVPHLLHRLDYNEHYFLDADFFKFLKLLDCYIYPPAFHPWLRSKSDHRHSGRPVSNTGNIHCTAHTACG